MPLSVPEPSSLPGWDPANPADVVDPGSTIKTTGFQATIDLVPTHHNWLFKTISDWIEYLQSVTNDLFGAEHTVTGADGGKHTAINANSLTWRTNRQVILHIPVSVFRSTSTLTLGDGGGGGSYTIQDASSFSPTDRARYVSTSVAASTCQTAAGGDRVCTYSFLFPQLSGPDDATTAQWVITGAYADLEYASVPASMAYFKQVRIYEVDTATRVETLKATFIHGIDTNDLADDVLLSDVSVSINPAKMYYADMDVYAYSPSAAVTETTTVRNYGLRLVLTRHRIE